LFFLAYFCASVNAFAGTTTADFLKWDRKAQISFFQISLSMLGTVATQVRPEMASCIDNWYFKTKAVQDKRHAQLLKTMPQYAEFDPTAFMLGYVESLCGRIVGK